MVRKDEYHNLNLWTTSGHFTNCTFFSLNTNTRSNVQIYLFVNDVAEYGVERCVPLSDLKSEEVLGRVQELASQK